MQLAVYVYRLTDWEGTYEETVVPETFQHCLSTGRLRMQANPEWARLEILSDRGDLIHAEGR